jgi:hypothetical protein
MPREIVTAFPARLGNSQQRALGQVHDSQNAEAEIALAAVCKDRAGEKARRTDEEIRYRCATSIAAQIAMQASNPEVRTRSGPLPPHLTLPRNSSVEQV